MAMVPLTIAELMVKLVLLGYHSFFALATCEGGPSVANGIMDDGILCLRRSYSLHNFYKM